MDNRELQRHRIFWLMVRIITALLAIGSIVRICWLKYAALYRNDMEYVNRLYGCDDLGRRVLPECYPDTFHIFIVTFFTALFCVLVMALFVAVILLLGEDAFLALMP